MKKDTEIITTKENIDDVLKFIGVTAFRYCILNKLDFSIGTDEDDATVAAELYEEMWVDENSQNEIKNKFTDMFTNK